jgi:hypothetical protein
MGALNLFGVEPDVFTTDSEAVGAMLATHAAIAPIADDVRLQFQSALASRDIIGQAKGMIMERFEVDAVRAFEVLTRLSQDPTPESPKWPRSWFRGGQNRNPRENEPPTSHPTNATGLCRGRRLKRSSRVGWHHLLKIFGCGAGGWREQQLPDGTLILTSPTADTYTTKPGSAVQFPALCRPTAPCGHPDTNRQVGQTVTAAR